MQSICRYVIPLLGVISIFGKSINAELPKRANSTCGLRDYLPNTKETAYRLPTISDNAQHGERIWETTIFGSVIGASYVTHAHAAYLGGGFNTGTLKYWFSANAKTQNFVKELQTKEIYRRIMITCGDGNEAKYSFIIPVQDMTPPEFEKEEFTFNINTDWGEHSISNQEIVVVSDRGNGLLADYRDLTYSSYPDILEVKAHPLWVFKTQARYFYRLDIYLKEDVVLKPGVTETMLSASDQFNTKGIKIIINLSSM